MSIFIDQIRTHDATNNGDDTVPPGVTGLDWCHMISTSDVNELRDFMTNNAIGAIANIRTPAAGSICTYVGLMQDDHDAAVRLGALRQRQPTVATASFDAPDPSGATFYEPIV